MKLSAKDIMDSCVTDDEDCIYANRCEPITGGICYAGCPAYVSIREFRKYRDEEKRKINNIQ